MNPPSRRDSQLVLAPLFTDHMVIQRRMPFRVWGQAVAGERVEVAVAGALASAPADARGVFEVELPALEAGGPHELVARAGDDSVRLEDVLVGEVWLCSGQSNMRWRVRQCADADPAATQATHPGLRLLDMIGLGHPGTRPWSAETLQQCTPDRYFQPARWRVSTVYAAATFSAVSFFFGLELHRALDVPVGLVFNGVGGAGLEAYLRRPGTAGAGREWLDDPSVSEWCRLRARRNLRDWLREPVGDLPGHPFQPSFLFEAGILPLARMALAGVVWYQGESNATHADNQTPLPAAVNRRRLEQLVADWREAFARPRLPFLQVQLPGFDRPWMEFRQAQLEACETPGVEMAVTIDLGHPSEEHPGRKDEIGRRLALLARETVLGEPMAWRGPRPCGVQLREDGSLELSFCDEGLPLAASDSRPLRGFEVAADDGVWHVAAAHIEGDCVVVAADLMPRPLAARYAWAPHPDANLVGAGGLPATPFRIAVGATPAVGKPPSAGAGSIGG